MSAQIEICIGLFLSSPASALELVNIPSRLRHTLPIRLSSCYSLACGDTLLANE